MKVSVRVPASSANLGPGFDILALALQIQLTVHAVGTDDGRLIINEHDYTPSASSHLLAKSYVHACDALSVPPSSHGASMTITSEIPQGRGLGSSAAVACAGVLCAAALHRADWDEQRVLEVVSEIEGHPDNAAASLLGGLTICVPQAKAFHIDIPDDLQAVLFIPQVELATEQARSVVPTEFSRADAVYNASRVGLLVRAFLTREYNTLVAAMGDAWHQPPRASLVPWLIPMCDAAAELGVGASLSGAGPSMIALTARDPEPVANAWRRVASAQSIVGEVKVVGLRNWGARVDVKP